MAFPGKIASNGIVDDNRFGVGERLDGMSHVGRHNANEARPHDLGRIADRQLELAFDHLVHFLLRMSVLVNGRTAHELIVNVMLADWK